MAARVTCVRVTVHRATVFLTGCGLEPDAASQPRAAASEAAAALTGTSLTRAHVDLANLRRHPGVVAPSRAVSPLSPESRWRT